MLCSLPCTRVPQRFIAGLAARRQPRFLCADAGWRRAGTSANCEFASLRLGENVRTFGNHRDGPARWHGGQQRGDGGLQRGVGLAPQGPRDIPPADPEHTTPGAGAWLPAPVSPTATDRRSPEPPGGPPETPRATRPLGSSVRTPARPRLSCTPRPAVSSLPAS